ncbi:MAG: DUF1254 domain-containing protein [Alphaproteobacteria bacterium]|nr:DUF1254 domain-containing protein [Alphaproteobacteria bacterium]
MLALIVAVLALAPAGVRAQTMSELRAAYQFAFPVYEMARTRAAAAGTASKPGLLPANYLVHRPTLADAASRGVTTPNNDTLYSTAWLDLSAGPVVLTIPPLPGRYHSAAVMNLFTDNDAVLGTRVNGEGGGRYALVGPGYRGKTPDGAEVVRIGTNDAWLLIRTLVDGPHDLAAAQAAQKGFKLDALGNKGRPVTESAPIEPDVATFVNVVNEMLGRGRLPSGATMRARTAAKAGIAAGRRFETLPAPMQALWRDNYAALRNELKVGLAGGATVVDGWAYGSNALGEYGSDDGLRARTALAGLGALPALEAMYITAVADAGGQPLDGAQRYRLRLPTGNVPVKAFWSLTMYQAEPDGRLFFIDNPLDRYAIGNRSPGLVRNPDGSLDILIGGPQPEGALAANWLPARPGPIRLVMRAYLPHRELLLGFSRLPALERLP